MMLRPTREELHMRTAYEWAQRTTCRQENRKVGCVITNWDMDQIVAFGYNGPAKGLPDDYCQATPTDRCQCCHAEMNAIAKIRGDYGSLRMFVTLAPCERCAHLIVNAGIRRLAYCEDYRDDIGLRVLKACDVKVVQMDKVEPERLTLVALWKVVTNGSIPPSARLTQVVDILKVELLH